MSGICKICKSQESHELRKINNECLSRLKLKVINDTLSVLNTDAEGEYSIHFYLYLMYLFRLCVIRLVLTKILSEKASQEEPDLTNVVDSSASHRHR